MGVYINGMEMPKTESEVLIIAIESDGSVYPVRIDGEGQPMIFPNEEMKNRAVPVPPHGDLIERKAICLTDFEIAMCGGNYKDGMKMLLEKIESAPTIIPAEED